MNLENSEAWEKVVEDARDLIEQEVARHTKGDTSVAARTQALMTVQDEMLDRLVGFMQTPKGQEATEHQFFMVHVSTQEAIRRMIREVSH